MVKITTELATYLSQKVHLMHKIGVIVRGQARTERNALVRQPPAAY
jgi:hypothetical protein